MLGFQSLLLCRTIIEVSFTATAVQTTILTWWHVAVIPHRTPTQGFFPPVPIQKNWSQDDWGSISAWCIITRTVIVPYSDFFPRPPEGLKISYPHYCAHCEDGRSLFPIPYNLDANAIRGISEYPPLLSVGPIIGIDRRSWLGYEYLGDMHTLGLLFHRSFHFPFWTNS
jgi:hypothetical protein